MLRLIFLITFPALAFAQGYQPGSATLGPGYIDVRTFGASTSRPDNDVPINAAIASAALISPPPEVVVPAGTWSIAKPIMLTGSNGLILRGQGMSQTVIQNTTYDGPHIYANGDTTAFPDAGSLATGPGVSMALSSTGTEQFSILNLSRAGYFWANNLNGLAQFNLSFYVKITSYPSDGLVVFYGDNAAAGGIAPDHNQHVTFSWDVEAGGFVSAALQIGGTRKVVGGAVPLNTVVECELDYDGAHLRSFVNGVLQDSTAATGTITSTSLQDFIIGPTPRLFPVYGSQTSTINGLVDSIRLSNQSRHTAGYTPPTAKFTQDSATIFLLNFDQITAPPVLVGALVNGGQVWYPWQSRSNAGSSGSMQIRDLGVSNGGQGIVALGTLQAVYKNIRCQFTPGCIYVDDFAYGSIVDNIFATGPGNATGLFGVFLGNVGLTSVKNLDIIGYQLPLVSNSNYIENAFISPSTYTVWGTVLLGDPALNSANSMNVLKDMAYDFENLNPNCQGAVYLQNIQKALVIGGAFDLSGTGNGQPTFTLSNCGQVEVAGAEFAGGSTPAPIFNFVGTLANPGVAGGNNPVVVRGGYRFKGLNPWVDAGMEQWVQIEEPGFSGGHRFGVTFVDGGTDGGTYNYAASFLDELVSVSMFTDAGTVTLPPCVSAAKGKRIPIKDALGKAAAWNITINVDGGASIDGAASKTINSNYGGLRPYCDGTSWLTEP